MDKEWRHEGRVRGRLFFGMVITAVGVIFMLNNLGIIEARNIFRVWFWPVLLIAFGVMHLVRGRAGQ